ncbi:hypothetical protein B0H11DRAFT_2030245 [Mycena galericulata]|nr:hypothetical protein B0H11DRAFT_2030245 [Mycena galericulata]
MPTSGKQVDYRLRDPSCTTCLRHSRGVSCSFVAVAPMYSPEPPIRPARSITVTDLLNPVTGTVSAVVPPRPRAPQPEVRSMYAPPSPDINYGFEQATWPTPPMPSSSSVAGPSQVPTRVVNQPNIVSSHQNHDYMFSNVQWPQEPGRTYDPPSTPYSAERTGDYPSREQHPTSYQQPASPGIDYSPWQRSERASPRIFARDANNNNYSYSTTSVDTNSRYSQYRKAAEQLCGYQDEGRQQVSQKRGVLDVEDAEEPPNPKRKLSAKTPRASSSTNRRIGYTTKKRSEAAQTAALNEEAPNMLYKLAPRPKSRDRDDLPYNVVPVEFPDVSNLVNEPQVSRCMSNRYKNEDIPRCVSCTRRWAGDTCRFQGIRQFCRESNGDIAGYCFQERLTHTTPMQYPDAWNIQLEKSHIDETKKTIAAALLPTLREELEHVRLPAVICRPRECEVRATCDTCLTSIFSCSWMCRNCGREACADCFAQVKMLTVDLDDPSQNKIDDLRNRREKHNHASPSFLTCMKRNEHGAKDFSPVTRFSKEELEDVIRDMEQLLRDESMCVGQPVPGAATYESSDGRGSTFVGSGPRTPPDVAPSPLSSDSEATLISNGDAAQPTASGSNMEIPSHEILRFKDADLTEEIFRPIWAKGEPLLVTDVGCKLEKAWSPEYFIKHHGSESCLIIECQTEQSKRITVGEFFSNFGRYERREECWKLKDWPPSSDFKTAFPELYEDFSQAVPIPNYVRRDGALNFASHFPSNTVGPDLGPKMYNANANLEKSDNKGSTRLHMDMADALNIMTYAAPDPDGGEGRAAWDLFRAEDSDLIRQFMRVKFSLNAKDPIHTQQVYLDDDARRELWDLHRVKSYRVYQTAGQAVFIPAGCAHQVRNLSDCIKVAIDFVSPENVQRCEQLTKEFREQNVTKVWKEDVLQLRTMMWFAWLSCCRQEKRTPTPS